uniref:Uncharacterized protein n=1 Tax=Arundo donax TaxID=35708 RepID=A0A0A9HIV4_ARUDO
MACKEPNSMLISCSQQPRTDS